MSKKVKSGHFNSAIYFVKVNNSQCCPNQSTVNGQSALKMWRNSWRMLSLLLGQIWSKQPLSSAHSFGQSQSLTCRSPSPEIAVKAVQSAHKILVKVLVNLASQNRLKNRSNEVNSSSQCKSKSSQNRSQRWSTKNTLSFPCVSLGPAISDLYEPIKRIKECVMMPPGDVTLGIFMWLMRSNFLL